MCVFLVQYKAPEKYKIWSYSNPNKKWMMLQAQNIVNYKAPILFEDFKCP